MEARDYFGKHLKGPEFAGFAWYEFPGIENFELLSSRFQFTANNFDSISEDFQSVVSRLREFAAGKKKLLHSTGNSKNIRMILTKPDRLEHWFYELCMKLDDGLFKIMFQSTYIRPCDGCLN